MHLLYMPRTKNFSPDTTFQDKYEHEWQKFFTVRSQAVKDFFVLLLPFDYQHFH